MSKQKKLKEANVVTEIRFLMLRHIAETPNLPEYIKPEVRQNMSRYISFMSSYLGTLELLWRRTKDVGMEG